MGNLYSRSPDPVMYISSPRMMDGAPLKQGCLSMTRWQSINLRGLEEARTHKDEKITYDLSIRNLQYKVHGAGLATCMDVSG